MKLSQDEYLDVVDENNQVIAQVQRHKVHQQNLRHRSAHILIYNQVGSLFLQKRSQLKDDFPGYWDSSAAGHVDAGETYLQCIIRETQEELGIVLGSTPEACFLLPASEENGMEFCQVFKTIHNGPFQLDQEEIETGAWFTQEEISDWIKTGGKGLTPSIQVMINKLSEQE